MSWPGLTEGLVGPTEQKPPNWGLCIQSSGWEAWALGTKAFLIGVTSAIRVCNKELPHTLPSTVLYKVLPTHKQLSTDGHFKWFHVKFSAQPLIILVPIKALPRLIKNFGLKKKIKKEFLVGDDLPHSKKNTINWNLDTTSTIVTTEVKTALLTSLWQIMS